MLWNNAVKINVTKCLGTCCRGGHPLLTGLAVLGLAAKRSHKAHLSAEQALEVFSLISPADIPSSLTDGGGSASTKSASRRCAQPKKVGRKGGCSRRSCR